MNNSSDNSATGLGVGLGFFLQLAIVVFLLATFWKVFAKAGKPGWVSLIPFYNAYVLLKISGKPGWWFLWYFVPVANLVVYVLVHLGLAENFGKGTGFAVGLILLPAIFYPILAFSDAKYVGSTA